MIPSKKNASTQKFGWMPKKPKKHTCTLTIAGFDGSGGAGIQADLKTFSALGCYGMSVLTALPVQNTMGVQSIYDIPDKCIEEQLRAICEDIQPDAIKIGMLHRPEVVQIILKALEKYSQIKVILDPVMLAKSGNRLLTPMTNEAMKEKLFPIATLITPNLPEASILLQREIKTREQMEQAALDLIKVGPKAALIKGGHLIQGPCDDCLCVSDPHPKIYWFSSPRITTKNSHGTGCTLSAAITAYLAKGNPINESVEMAKKYIFECIKAGADFKTGQGNGPVHHFHAIWKET